MESLEGENMLTLVDELLAADDPHARSSERQKRRAAPLKRLQDGFFKGVSGAMLSFMLVAVSSSLLV
jgi:hypothetical protein